MELTVKGSLVPTPKQFLRSELGKELGNGGLVLSKFFERTVLHVSAACVCM